MIFLSKKASRIDDTPVKIRKVNNILINDCLEKLAFQNESRLAGVSPIFNKGKRIDERKTMDLLPSYPTCEKFLQESLQTNWWFLEIKIITFPFLNTLTAWKVSKYGVISGPYFPVFSPNTGKYGTEITPYLDTFHAMSLLEIIEIWRKHLDKREQISVIFTT